VNKTKVQQVLDDMNTCMYNYTEVNTIRLSFRKYSNPRYNA